MPSNNPGINAEIQLMFYATSLVLGTELLPLRGKIIFLFWTKALNGLARAVIKFLSMSGV